MAPPHDPAANDAGCPIFYVGAGTVPLALAAAIAKVLRKHLALELQAIGPGAVYRATQALTLARVLLAKDGSDLAFSPRFGETTVDGARLVGLVFDVEEWSSAGRAPISSGQS